MGLVQVSSANILASLATLLDLPHKDLFWHLGYPMPKPAQLHCSSEPQEHPLGLSLPGGDCSASLSAVWECCATFDRDLSLLSAVC